MSTFKVHYRLIDGSKGEGVITGPFGRGTKDCEKILRLAASNYSIKPNSFIIESVPERTSHGFIHPLYAKLEDGREALIQNWYY